MINDILRKSLDYNGPDFSDLLQEKLDASGLTRNQFEIFVGIEKKSLDNILNKTSIQTDINKIIILAEFLDLTLEEMLIINYHNRDAKELADLQECMDLTFINKHFDLKTLTSIGFINKKFKLADLKSRICNYFGIKSIYEYDTELSNVLFSKTKRTFSNKMKFFWIQSSIKYFELINNPNEYDRKSLIQLIPKIKPYTRNVEHGLKTVFQALYNVGVTVVFQPSVPTVQARGATFIVNDKPCITITDLNKNYATIWFALIHELHHVLYDLDELKNLKYHITGEPDLFLMHEDAANKFASDYLFSDEKMRYIEKMIHNKLMVSRFAEECQIHPCIIYSQYQWRQSELGNDYWRAFKDQFPSVSKTTKYLNIANIDTETIEESANKIKELLNV